MKFIKEKWKIMKRKIADYKKEKIYKKINNVYI